MSIFSFVKKCVEHASLSEADSLYKDIFYNLLLDLSSSFSPGVDKGGLDLAGNPCIYTILVDKLFLEKEVSPLEGSIAKDEYMFRPYCTGNIVLKYSLYYKGSIVNDRGIPNIPLNYNPYLAVPMNREVCVKDEYLKNKEIDRILDYVNVSFRDIRGILRKDMYYSDVDFSKYVRESYINLYKLSGLDVQNILGLSTTN